jgi:hypothetical protein
MAIKMQIIIITIKLEYQNKEYAANLINENIDLINQ